MAEKDSVQIKKRLTKELPQYKFSITRDDFAGGHSVNVKVLSGPKEVFANQEARDNSNGYIDIFRQTYKDDERINDKIKTDIDKMYKIIYEIGQFPSGYHGGPYLHWRFGSYLKPYEVIGSNKSTPETRSEKSSVEKNTNSELLMSFSQGWNLYKTTINKKGSDGNPLTLVVYNLNKTKELENIPYVDFLEFKGEMLTSLNMKWGKFQKFEKWTYPVDTDVLKVIIEKYYGAGEAKKEEPIPQSKEQEFKVGDKFLMTRTGETFEIDYITNYNIDITYSDGLTGFIDINKLNKGIASGYYKKVIDEEKDEELTFKVGDKFTIKNYEGIFKIKSINKEDVIVNLTTSNEDLKFNLSEVKRWFESGVWIKVVDEEVESGSEEDIKKAIAALEILALDGDEEAVKGIKALKILLN